MEIQNTVLICDDNLDIREVTSLVLKQLGYKVVCCDSGRDIFKTIKESAPSIILLDIRLPDISGDLLTRQLKTYNLSKHIPVILFSAVTGGKAIAELVCADGFLAKPFEISQLENIIKIHLGLNSNPIGKA